VFGLVAIEFNAVCLAVHDGVCGIWAPSGINIRQEFQWTQRISGVSTNHVALSGRTLQRLGLPSRLSAKPAAIRSPTPVVTTLIVHNTVRDSGKVSVFDELDEILSGICPAGSFEVEFVE
jgi:hypothetical protein